VNVAYQGEPGAFSEDAARKLIPGAKTRGYGTFDEVFYAALAGETEAALMPVENSISGAVPRVYDLLFAEPRARIVAETVYRVEQNLIGLPAADLRSLREVRSHPVALEQCRAFFARHPHARPHVVADTAGAVREIVALDDPGVAAIGSALAAERYGAEILERGIQDVHDNFTRFFLIRADATPPPLPTRACVALVLPHRPGSLRDALSTFAERGLNLRTLVSRPALDAPFTYRFYVEIEQADAARLSAALGEIEGEARILGTY
jgi:prephenate dehydratase